MSTGGKHKVSTRTRTTSESGEPLTLQDHSPQRPEVREDSGSVSVVIQHLHLQQVFCTYAKLTRPWGVDIPEIPGSLMFHNVLEGECEVDVFGKVVHLRPGDFLMVPHGQGHQLRDHESTPCLPLFELPLTPRTAQFDTLECGGGGEPTLLICGAVSFDNPLVEHMMSLMPEQIYIARESPAAHSTQNTMQMLVDEARQQQLGSMAAVERLTDLVVIQSIRAWLGQEDSRCKDWLAAMENPRLGAALTHIHEQPGHPWTVAELAEIAAMSRTAFSQSFKQTLGESPLSYLTRWRMTLAQFRLRQSQDSILHIALDLGYQSEAAFGRAFKKMTGQSPGALRESGGLPLQGEG